MYCLGLAARALDQFLVFSIPCIGICSAHLNVLCAPEAVIVGQRPRGRCILIEPERDLRLDGSPEVVIPGCAIGNTCRIQVDVELAARGCGGAIDDLA